MIRSVVGAIRSRFTPEIQVSCHRQRHPTADEDSYIGFYSLIFLTA